MGRSQRLMKIVELPVGEIGEIIVRGPSVTRGYDKRPDADAEAKIRDGERHWHRMGDMGWIECCGAALVLWSENRARADS